MESASTAIDAGELAARMGIVIDALDPDTCCGHMPVEGNTQPTGILHGGASAALAETLASFAAFAHARKTWGETHPGVSVVGVDLSITHLRPARSGDIVHGIARALHRGRRLATYAVTITCQETVIASARLTAMVTGLESTTDR